MGQLKHKQGDLNIKNSDKIDDSKIIKNYFIKVNMNFLKIR